MKAKLFPFLSLLLFLVGCGGGGDKGNPGASPSAEPAPVKLVSITVTADGLDDRNGGTKVDEVLALPLGFSTSFVATGIYSDGSSMDLTEEAVWSPVLGTIGQIEVVDSSKGELRGVFEGAAEIRVEYEGVTGRGSIDVFRPDSVSIAISSPAAPLAPNMRGQCSATGEFVKGTTRIILDVTSQVQWNSSDPSVVTISNLEGEKGVATGVNYGFSDITTTKSGYGASAPVRIAVGNLLSIEVVRPPIPMHPNLLAPFRAIGTWEGGYTRDITEEATWRSSSIQYGPVSNTPGSKGVVTLRTDPEQRNIYIYATYGDVEGSHWFWITNARPVELRVQPVDAYGPVNLYFTYTVDCRFSDNTVVDVSHLANWGVSNPSILSVNNTDRKGYLITRQPGRAEVSAEWQNLRNATPVTVLNPPPLELHMWYPHYGDWLQYPLPETCDGVWCREGTGIPNTNDEFVYRTFRLVVNDGPLRVRNLVARDQNNIVSARFSGITEGQELNAGQEITFDIRCDRPRLGAQAKVEWSFDVEGGQLFPLSGKQFLITAEIHTLAEVPTP